MNWPAEQALHWEHCRSDAAVPATASYSELLQSDQRWQDVALVVVENSPFEHGLHFASSVRPGNLQGFLRYLPGAQLDRQKRQTSSCLYWPVGHTWHSRSEVSEGGVISISFSAHTVELAQTRSDEAVGLMASYCCGCWHAGERCRQTRSEVAVGPLLSNSVSVSHSVRNLQTRLTLVEGVCVSYSEAPQAAAQGIQVTCPDWSW